ncbi:SIR2 family protein [Gaetbulibacter jejuensis]|uniref:SIR2-like domain-containing protein n=1 Tax=Gaetbulibacter jejuensis TaxID=584607 RepID=A0ABP3V1M8_9FLAO
MNYKGTIPPELIDSIKNGKCILFVGAGLSAKIKRTNRKQLPLWGAFLSELLEWAKSKNAMFWNGPDEIEEIIKKGNYLLAAQELQECVTLGEFSEFLNSVFRDLDVKPSETHKNIFKIPFRALLTTNYDNLLEGAYALTHSGQVPIKFTQEDLNTISSPLRSEEFFIFKIHGDVDRPESIILGSRSYNQILFRTPEYIHFLETLFTTHTVLFVGFSGEDVDFDFVINRLSTIYSRTLNKHYILLPNSKYNLTEKRRLLLDKRLEVIEYEPDKTHSQVDAFFESLDDIISNKTSVNKDKKTNNNLPTKKDRGYDTTEFLIISSKTFQEKYNDLVGDVISNIGEYSGWMWFYGLESLKEDELINDLLKRAKNVIIFFDEEVLKIKEVEYLFDIITLREIDKQMKIVPIGIGSFDAPVFLRRRMTFLKEPVDKRSLSNIIKSQIRIK